MNQSGQSTDPSQQPRETQPGNTVPPTGAASEIPNLPVPMPQSATARPAAPQPSDAVNFFQPDDSDVPEPNPVNPLDPQMSDNGNEVVWTAAEFIEHDKSPAWFLAMVGISVAAIGIVYLITRDPMNALLVAIAAVLFGVAAGRPPRHMQYAVNDHGISIGRKFFDYSNFRSFSVIDEGITRSIMLMPLKRFMPTLTLYYDLDDEQRIGDVLADHLPFAQHELQLTEKLMRRIRF